MEHEDGTKAERKSGTPQGGVVSPILSNLFLHYTFDLWMARTHPDLPWCRYADDGLVHCRNEQEAQTIKAELQARLAECRLELHPTKTKIVYCKDKKRKGMYAILRIQSRGQPLGDENHAVGDSGIEYSPSNAVVIGRNCSAAQSSPAGLD